MSELIQKHDTRTTIRWKLLTGVSALALTAYVSSVGMARAEDSDRPQAWIELGGQLSHLEDSAAVFTPPLFDDRPSIFSPSQKFEKQPLYSIEEFGRISFQPENSSWIFAASIRYGRSTSTRHVHQQTYPGRMPKYLPDGSPAPSSYPQVYPSAAKFADTKVRNSEQYAILDFQAGKDVGLGMFGKEGSSVFNFGVRFAQFASKSNIVIGSDPDWHFLYKYLGSIFKSIENGQPFHSNAASFSAQRSFLGIGPSISWTASAPFVGSPRNGELTLDWGANAAFLFGRQKATTHHQSTARYHPPVKYGAVPIATTSRPPPVDHMRSRSVLVPNVGGFAGLSFRYADAKVSFGYRADMFFGAIDGGVDTRKSEGRGFFGPFASVSVGLGG